MKLVFPTYAYKDKAIRFIDEFYEYDSQINGSGGLDRYLKTSTYEEWIGKIHGDMDIANIPESKVPALTYFYVREEDDQILGMVNIRLALNDFLKREGGHIGYCVRPTERQKHHATQMLQEALNVLDAIGIREVIVTCDKSNIASAKVIQNCGGNLAEELYSNVFKSKIQKYIIYR